MCFNIKIFSLPRAMRTLSLAFSLLFAHAVLTDEAVAAGPFNGIDGYWTGSGVVTYASGTRERLRCTAQYVQNNPDNLQQALRCASDSYNFQINAYFEHSDGTLRGRWDELSLDISGTVTGSAVAGLITGILHGPGFTAGIEVSTDGSRQMVKIETPDQEIRQVLVEIRRSGG